MPDPHKLEHDPLLMFLWKNNSSLGDFDNAVRVINKSSLKLKRTQLQAAEKEAIND